MSASSQRSWDQRGNDAWPTFLDNKASGTFVIRSSSKTSFRTPIFKTDGEGCTLHPLSHDGQGICNIRLLQAKESPQDGARETDSTVTLSLSLTTPLALLPPTYILSWRALYHHHHHHHHHPLNVSTLRLSQKTGARSRTQRRSNGSSSSRKCRR